MIDFLRLARDYHIPTMETGHHHCHAGWVQTHCPFCAGARSGWHLGFSLEQGNFHCWRCGSVRFWSTLLLLLRLSRDDQLKQIVSKYQTEGSKIPVREPVARPRHIKPPPGSGPLAQVHREYLRRRNFDPHILAHEWGVSATQHLSGSWNWRVIFPIKNQAGMTVAYQGRTIGEGKPKYKLTDEEKCLQDPRSLLYGIDRARGNSVLIVEGATDVWRIGPGAVATLGIDWKIEQANQLRRFRNRYVMFDPEPKAQEQALSLARHLSLFEGHTELVSGLESDPGDFSQEVATGIRQMFGLR